MPEVTTNPPGSFCWPELGTSDYAAAKAFCTSVFGWDVTESEMVPGEYYTTFLLGGRRIGAGYQLNAEMRSQGAPPHWMSYVCVANADETAEAARRLGGHVVMGPIDVMEHGRMAVIRDPQGR